MLGAAVLLVDLWYLSLGDLRRNEILHCMLDFRVRPPVMEPA